MWSTLTGTSSDAEVGRVTRLALADIERRATPEGADQLPVFGLRIAVGFARKLLQPLTIADDNAAALGADRTSTFQNMQRHRHAGALTSDHHRHELMGERQVIAIDAVVAHQQPTSEPRLQRMMSVADRAVRDLDQVCVNISQ